MPESTKTSTTGRPHAYCRTERYVRIWDTCCLRGAVAHIILTGEQRNRVELRGVDHFSPRSSRVRLLDAEQCGSLREAVTVARQMLRGALVTEDDTVELRPSPRSAR